MAAKRLSMRKIREILRLRHERGFTHRTIARAVHVGAATVSEYLAKAAAKGLGWPLAEEFSDAKLEEVLFPRPPASSEREVPDFAAVHEELQRHRELTLLQLWVEYAEDNPRAYRYSRYCELYHRWKKKLRTVPRYSMTCGGWSTRRSWRPCHSRRRWRSSDVNFLEDYASRRGSRNAACTQAS